MSSEVEQLRAKQQQLMKQQRRLEEEIDRLKRHEEAAKGLQVQVKALLEENEKLRGQLATQTLPGLG